MDLYSNEPVADFMLPLDSLTSVDRLSKISTKSEESLLSRVSEITSSSIILLLGSFAVSYLLSDLLLKFEWLQDWRYFWPLVGTLYVADPVMRFWKKNQDGRLSDDNPSLLPFDLSTSRGIQILSLVGGLFTLIGGAYDAFMPVWQTGPNVFTIAGIGQDGAIMLLLVTAISIFEEKWKKNGTAAIAQYANTSGSNRSLLQILLLAELYKLGESSMDEILSAVESLSNSING